MSTYKKINIFSIAAMVLIFVLIFIYHNLSLYYEIPPLTLTVFISTPAAVIVVAQLMLNNILHRANYIREYNIRFRTDKELNESFHYLVYKYGNEYYETFKKSLKECCPKEKIEINALQEGVEADLKFYDPFHLQGTPQERRLDNLLGFFDSMGYDLKRGLITIEDVSGLFGYQLDHFNQRNVVNDYIFTIYTNWPHMDEFHKDYRSPIPFKYFRYLKDEHAKHQIKLNEARNRLKEKSL